MRLRGEERRWEEKVGEEEQSEMRGIGRMTGGTSKKEGKGGENNKGDHIKYAEQKRRRKIFKSAEQREDEGGRKAGRRRARELKVD